VKKREKWSIEESYEPFHHPKGRKVVYRKSVKAILE